MNRWEPGGYRLVNSATESDGGQSLTLIENQGDRKSARPKFLLRTEGIDFSVKQSTRWSLDPGGMSLTSEIQYDLSRGQLFAVEARLPKSAAWRVASVDVLPRDAMQKWSVAGGILRVDLQRGITPRSDFKLIVQLQDERDKSPKKSATLDIPDLQPLGAQVRQGTLAILADPHQRVSLVQSNLPPVRPEPAQAKDPRLQFAFAYRQTPIQGKIRLVPQQPVIQAKTQQYVSISPDSAKIKSAITIEPIVGQPSEIDLFFTGATRDPTRIDAKGAEIVERKRVPISEVAGLGLRLAASTPFAQAAVPLVEPRGQVWRIVLREPIFKSITFTTQHELAPLPRGPLEIPPPLLPLDHGVTLLAISAKVIVQSDWDLPVVVPLDAERIDGEIIVQPLAATLSAIQPRGFEAIGGSAATGALFSRRFRFGRAGLLDSPSLKLTTNRRDVDDAAHAVIDLVEHTVTVDPTGNVVHDLRIHVWNWRAGDFRLMLPRDCQVIGGRLNQTAFDRVAQTPIPDGLEVLIPLIHDAGAQAIHLRYRSQSTGPMGSLGRVVGMPLPKLPLEPLRVDRELRLAPQWLPFRQEDMFSCDRQSPGSDSVRSFWRMGEALVAELMPPSSSDGAEQNRFALLSAEAALRRSAPHEMSLAEALARLTLDRNKDTAIPLALDRAAVRTLGLSAKMPVSVSPEGGPVFWERIGLVAVSFRAGTVLTTHNLAAGLREAERRAAPPEAPISAAVDQSLGFGQDASGRFVSVDSWLRTDPAGRASADLATLREDGRLTIWRPLAGTPSSHQIALVRPSHVRGLAIVFAIATLGIGLILRRIVSAQWSFGGLGIALCLGISAIASTPWSIRELLIGPLIAAAGLLVLSYRDILRRVPGRRDSHSRSKASHVATASMGAFIVVAVASAIALGQEPAARFVYILDSQSEPTARAFVRPETLRWLEEQERPVAPSMEGAVVLAARYLGRAEQDAVKVDGEFDIFAFSKDVVVTVPLAGVDLLEGSEIDGQPAFPVVSPAPKTGYQLSLKDEGPHRVKLRFLARPNAAGDVTWAGPSAFCSSLRVTAPATLRALRLGKGLGAESLQRESGAGEQTLDAQLGRDAVVLIHGLGAPPAPAAPSLNVRELYAWDLRPGNRSLQGLLAYTAVGETRLIEVNLPSGLEVRSVELSDAPGAAAKGVIKTWRLVPRDGGRILQVEFLRPLTGSFQLVLGMTLRGTANANLFDLRLPLPLRAIAADGLLAFRAEGAEAAVKAQSIGVAAVALELFGKEWLKVAQREIAAPLQAYSFARAAKNAAGATLEVALTPGRPRVQMEMALTALPQTIDVDSRLSISATDELILLGLLVPENLMLRDVQGADVHHWSRQGNQMHVWLVGPRKKTSLAILGWIPHSYPNAKSIKIPPVQLDGATIDAALLTLESASSLAIEAKGGAALTEEPAGEGLARRFRSASGTLPGEFRIKTQPGAAEFASLAVLEANLGRGALALHVRGRVSHGEFPEFQIRVSRWPSAAPQFVSSVPGLKVKHAMQGGDHVWTLAAPPGTPQQVNVTIKDSVPLSPGTPLEFPHLKIERGGTLVDSVMAMSGAQVVGGTTAKFASVRSSTKELMPWPIEHARLRAAGSLFARVPFDSPPVRVQANETIPTPPAQILAARHRAFVGEPDRWLHQMEWTLWSKSGLDLEIALPEGAKLAAALVDDLPANPRQTGPEALSLTIAASDRVRSVVVAWTYPPSVESMARPRLAHARLRELAPPAIHEEIFVPAGWNVPETEGIAAPMDAILDDLRTELNTLRLLGDELALAGKAGQPTLAQSLQQFAALVRQAQYRLRVGEFDSGAREDAEAKLKSAVEDWRKTAKELGLDAARAAAEKAPWHFHSRSWPLGASAGAPRSRLQPAEAAEKALHLQETRAVKPPASPILPVLGVVILCLWPALLRVWVRLWPEQLAAVAIVGMAAGGPSIVGGMLIIVAAIGRTMAIASVLRRWFRKRMAIVAH